MRVLVLLNDPNERDDFERVCASLGHDCLGAAADVDGGDEDAHFDLAIIRAPLAVAADLTERIRARRDDRPMFALVVGPAPGDADSSPLECGADDFLFRPYSDAQLKLRIELAERRLREQARERCAQRALRESSDQITLAADGAGDGLWYTHAWPDGSYDLTLPVWYSPQMKALLGFGEHEFENVLASWANRLHPADRTRVFQAIDDHLYRRAAYDVEYRLRHKSGEYRWFSARGQGSWDPTGRPLRMAGSIRDITQRRAELDALRKSESQYRLIAETVDDIIWTVEIPATLETESTVDEILAAMSHLSIRYISPAVERVLGYPVDEARRMALAEFLTPAAYRDVLEEFKREFGSLADRQTQEQRVLELDHVTRDGGVRCCEIVCVVIRDDEGTPRWVTGVSRDITQRKRAELALRREREFLRRVVDVHERERRVFALEIHDTMMPDITAALMQLEAFAANEPAPPKASGSFHQGLELLRSVGDATRRLISLLRPPILDEAGIVVAIEYLVNEHRQKVGEVNFECQASFDRLTAPLENAVFRFVEEALINVRRHSRCRRALVRLEEAGDRLRVEVRDWGVGFQPDQVADDRFGLEGIRERARLLGGEAHIESSPGHGARIRVELPLTLAG